MTVDQSTCGCGTATSSNASIAASAGEPCSCGCCGAPQATTATPERIAELRALRADLDRQLAELEDA